MTLLNRIRKWLANLGPVPVEEEIAAEGGGWDGLELGKLYKAYVVDVPERDELTPEGKPKMPVCRVKDRNGHFMGRYIVTEVDREVKIGEKRVVLITGAQARVLFAVAEE